MHLGIIIFVLLYQAFDYRHAAQDPKVLPLLQELARRGALQSYEREVAAFLVRETSGAIRLQMWPRTAAVHSERYDGPIPAGTVAIAHTHPIHEALPSRDDVKQAKRVGLPIFVITRWHLYVIDPSSGARVALIENRGWMRSRLPAEAQAMRK